MTRLDADNFSPATRYRFDGFELDLANRQLFRDGQPVDLNARYFDALALLVRERGRLVSKDRFFDEVWDDVVVSDSALTQCIKDVRKRLGDDAADPRFIRTVPRHGYQFIGDVEAVGSEDAAAPASPTADAERLPPTTPPPPAELGVPTRLSLIEVAARWGVAGAAGGAVAGALGGVLYGLSLASAPSEAQMGTVSLIVVLVALNVAVGLAGGGGIGAGMAVARGLARRSTWWDVLGGAVGGALVGGLAHLLGVDAFRLLFGQAPAGITGGAEGAALGAAIALGVRFGGGLGAPVRWRPIVAAGLATSAAGMGISAAGGRLMGGSLDLLARSFAQSRLELDPLGRYFGEVHFGPVTQLVLSGVEGLLFGACVAGALVVASAMGPPRPLLSHTKSG